MLTSLLFSAAQLSLASSSGLAPLSFIPQELIEYFHPLSRNEQTVLPGFVDRQRRELSDDQAKFIDREEDHPTFRISKNKVMDQGGVLQEEDCMFIKTRARFVINFRTRSPSPVNVDSKTYDMPLSPEKVNGTCALETETSRIFIFWPGFNFSIEFTKNPEGNSYYMNRAILVYNTNHPDLAEDFKHAENKGRVHLETRPGKNFFFTPLGSSYICTRADDQGPLKLFNIEKNEIEGHLELRDTRFQPFVVRAHGVWGPPKRCLPNEIRKMREDFWPWVSAGLVLLMSSLLVGGYGVKRTWFTEQKVDYGGYSDEAGRGGGEMEMVKQPEQEVTLSQEEGGEEQKEIKATPIQEAPGRQANPFQQKASNPFQKASNPFQGYGAT